MWKYSLILCFYIFIQFTGCKTISNTEKNYIHNIILIRNYILKDLNINNNRYRNIEDIFSDLFKNNKIIFSNITREQNIHDINNFNYIYEIIIENNIKLTLLKPELMEVYYLITIYIDLNKNIKYKLLFPHETIDKYLLDEDFGNMAQNDINTKGILYTDREDWEYIYLNFNNKGKIDSVIFCYNVD